MIPQTIRPRIMRSPAGIAAMRAHAQPSLTPQQPTRYDGPPPMRVGANPAREGTMVGNQPSAGPMVPLLGGPATPGPVPNAGEPVSRRGIGSSYDAGDGLGVLPGHAVGARYGGNQTPMPRPAFVPKSPIASNVLGGKFGGAQSFAELMRGASGRAAGYKNEYLGPQSTAVSMAPTADQEVTGSEPTGSEPGGGFATSSRGLGGEAGVVRDSQGRRLDPVTGRPLDDPEGNAKAAEEIDSQRQTTEDKRNAGMTPEQIAARDALVSAGFWLDQNGNVFTGSMDEPQSHGNIFDGTLTGRARAVWDSSAPKSHTPEDILREILGWDAPEMDQRALDEKIRADEAQSAYQTGKGIQSALGAGGRARMGAGWMAGQAADLSARGGLQHQQTAANMRLQAEMQNFAAQRDFFDRQIQAIMAMAGYADSQVARDAVARLQSQRIEAERSLAELQHQWSQEITPASILGLIGSAGGQVGGALLGKYLFGGT